MRSQVLFLSCHLPSPPLSGGRRRELELITRLAERFDVHLLVVSKTPDADHANADGLAPFCTAVEVFPAVPPDAEQNAAELNEPVQVLRHRSRAATRHVRRMLAEGMIDIVHVEGFYLMQHVPDWVDVPVLLVEQNIEYELEHQRARTDCDGVTRIESFLRAVRTRAAELDCWRRATRLATVTLEDRATIRRELTGAAVTVVPDGVDHLSTPSHRHSDPLSSGIESGRAPLVMLLANFGYAPNVDAARFLCDDILPLVRRSVPNLQLWLVGNAPPADVFALDGDGVCVTGFVPDVLPYLDAADVVVCPLRIGGGIKLKTIEALRRGKALVSTHIGAQGLPVGARRAMWIEDDPERFASAVASLLRDPEHRSRLELLAVRASCTLPSWAHSAAALTSLYDELLEADPSRRRLLREIPA